MDHKAAVILLLLGATSFSGLSAVAAERSFSGRWQQIDAGSLSVSIMQSGDVVSIFNKDGWCTALVTPGSNMAVASGACPWFQPGSRSRVPAEVTVALYRGLLYLMIKSGSGKELKAILEPFIPPAYPTSPIPL